MANQTEESLMIEIKLSRCVLGITETEMLAMLESRPDIWERALRRGKHIQRAEKALGVKILRI